MTTAGGRPVAIRAATLLLAALASLVVAICGYSALARIGNTFPGFFVWENGFVPAVGLGSWSGVRAGLPYHSVIESFDGSEAFEASQLEALVAARAAGTPIEYRYTRGLEHGRVRVPTERFGVLHFLASTGVYLFDAIVLLLLAVVMFYARAEDEGPRAVGLFAVAQSLYLATAIDLFGPYHFRELYFFFAGLMPTATLFMISRFPVERRIGRAENAALLALLAASLGFGLLSNRYFFGDLPALLRLDLGVHLAIAAGAVTAFVFFGWHFLRGRTELVRRRCQVVLLASMGGFLPTAVFLVAVYVGGVELPFNVLALPFVLFPLGIGYAVGRHDLFDVDTVVKRSIVYATLSAAVFAIYFIAINAFDVLFENATPVASRMAEGALIVLLMLLFDPSRRRLQETVGRLYDRRRWVYRDVVRSAVRAFSTVLDVERLLPSVLSLVDETVQPTFASIYTMDGGVLRLRGELHHAPGGQASIDVVSRDVPTQELLVVAREAARREVLTGAEAEAAGAAVVVALTLEDRPTGLVLAGPRRSGAGYTREDLDLLRTIAGQLAVALQNADSYRTIATLNRDLEDRNVALRTTLSDLHEAQDELVIKERLAAIGEIAGAVAHTIRNPLAGMRAAAQQASIELAEHPVTELVDAFVRETDRLSSRIDSLLDFARPYHVARKPAALDDIAARAASQVRGRARQRNVEIDASRLAPAPAFVDPDLFEQLAVELIANAVDASPDSAVVELASGRDADGRSWLEVADAGAGIAPDKREKMFRMFFTTKAKGTGVGLATVKRIADAHQARVEVGSAPGGGASFRVSLASADTAGPDTAADG